MSPSNVYSHIVGAVLAISHFPAPSPYKKIEPRCFTRPCSRHAFSCTPRYSKMAAHKTDNCTNGQANGKNPNAFDVEEKISTKEATDINCWRLLDERGRQTWHYLDSPEKIKQWPQSIVDKHHISLPLIRQTIYLFSIKLYTNNKNRTSPTSPRPPSPKQQPTTPFYSSPTSSSSLATRRTSIAAPYSSSQASSAPGLPRRPASQSPSPLRSSATYSTTRTATMTAGVSISKARATITAPQ